MIPESIVEQALEVIRKSRSNYEYFFSRLTSPDWLDPLYKHGFFREPEKPVPVEGGVRYPPWPDSSFLARVAEKAPKKVLEIALRIPDTNNPYVHYDLALAALSMPAAMAATWVRKEVEWLKEQRRVFFLLPDELGKLITHLAEGGEVDAALALARALLEPHVPEKKSSKEAEGWPENPVLIVEPYNYSELLRLHVPDLAGVSPLETLEMLSDHLEAAIRIYLRRDDDEPQPPGDYSYLWRSAIEEHKQNELGDPYDVKKLLAIAIRDIAERLVHKDPSMLASLVELLEERRWHIFRRIALHLLRRFAQLEEARPLIAERLVSKERLLDIGEQHEYGLLLRDHFCQLNEEDQASILEFIDTGFDREAYARGLEIWRGQTPTEDEIAAAHNEWRLRRLSFIAHDLPAERKEQYESLMAALGAPEHAEFPSGSAMWLGPTSPKSDEELASMTIDELTAFLQEWQPSGTFADPSQEGLGRGLTALVRARLEEFASQADHFVKLDPTYVRAVLEGFAQAVGEKQTFEWPAVLRLARWVVEQPREIPGRSGIRLGIDLDSNWGGARKAAARLLGIAFESQPTSLPAELRTLVWEILRPITDDPEPTPDYEEQYGGSNMDPLTLSINTTRGEAVHSVVRYCLWIRRQFESTSNTDDRLKHGFGEMPEAREVLETHLDPASDPSMAIRAVYGQWLPWLVLLDEEWARANLGKIFPEDLNLLALRESVWDTYVVVNKAYANLLELLHDQYVWAIDRMGSESRIKGHLGDPDTAVASHLMVYYWQGRLDLDDSDGLLARLYARAPDSVRGHAIQFIGRALASTPDTPQRVSNRLQRLWEKRLSQASDADREEVAAFGWWFVSKAFDDKWLITNLREALKRVGKTEPAHMVVERLAQIATSFPLAAVECLGYMVRGDEEGWGLHMWRDSAKAILTTALASDSLEAREAAQALTHELGARGRWEYRDVLSERSAESPNGNS